MTSPYAIRVRHLWHRFGTRTVLHDVSFDVAHGEIFGFIGPNGAGKTTTIRAMATLLEPTAGRIEIDGIDVSVHPERVRRTIGYMPDHAGVYERVTVREYLDFFARAYHVPDLGVVDAVLELTDLAKLQDRLVIEMSKGMKQRLQLARILLHDPKVLILDEPASDLDPRARIEIRDLLVELRSLGKTIFLSSHILTELSDVCTSVAILEKGRLVVSGPIGEIAQRLAYTRHGQAVMPPSPEPAVPTAPAEHPVASPPVPVPQAHAIHRKLKIRILGQAQAAAPYLHGGPGIVSVEAHGDSMLVAYVGDDSLVAAMVRHLVMNGVPVIGVEPERNELERIFLEVTRGELQ